MVNRMKPSQQIKLASAGTGKTFSLSNTYLGLFTNGKAPSEIMASTFTRKAAAEILKRLFERLVEGVNDAEKLQELKDFSAIPSDWCVENVKACVVKLALSIDKIRVSTLDSYFNKVASQHRRELGLPLQWRMSEVHQDAELLQSAIGNYVAQNSLDDIVSIVSSLGDANAPRDFLDKLLSETTATLDLISDCDEQSWDCVSPFATNVSSELLLAKLDGINNIIERKGAESKTKTMVDAVSDGDVKAMVHHSVYADNLWYKKPIHDDWVELCPLVHDYARSVATQQVIARNKTYARLFKDVQSELLRLRQQSRLFSFSDITRLIASAVVEQRIDLSDSALDLLLDEFQDTSVLQWRILQPQITASIERQRSLFTVGDTKQAIYGWRSGDSRLLSGFKDWSQKNTQGGCVEQSTLEKNFRSSAVILDTTDLVFGKATQLVPNSEEVATAINAWTADYEKHVADKNIPGCALLFEVEKTDTINEKLALAKAAAARAAKLHEQAPSKSIAILVRQNSMLALIQDELRKLDVQAGSHGGVAITDAESVLIALSWLTAVFYPGDTLARFHVQTSQLSTFGDENDLSDEQFDRHAQLQRRTILSIGFGDYLRRHVDDLQSCFPSGHDRHRLQQLLDLAYRFDALSDKDALGFVEFIHTTKVSDSSATKVRLMTIHAAKGLEFDAVILPQMNDSLIGNIHRQIAVGSRPSTIAPYSNLCAYPSATHAELIPELAKFESELKTARASEALSLMYVALTRAVERVEMMVPPASKSGATDRVSCLLRNGIDCVDSDTKLLFADNAELSLKWQHPQSDLNSWAQEDLQEIVAQPEKASPFTASKTPRLLKRVAPSQVGAGNYRGADILGEFNQAAMTRGSKIHALLENCEWLEDFTTDDSELQVMLSKEHVLQKLSRPPVGDFEVWRERNFSALINEGDSSYILRGCFDRVVIHLDSNGKKVAAEIIDYKTGTINDISRMKYQAQLDEYSKALQLLLDLGVDDISCCLLELDA